MKKSTVVRSLAGAICCLLAWSVPGANASQYTHTSVVQANAVDWTPNLVVVAGSPKPVALSIAEAGDQMVVGGRFSKVENGSRTQQYDRTSVFAFSAETGTVHSGFRPVVDGDVWSVLSDGISVYIGGNFKTINGAPRAALAKVSLATGVLDTTFNPPFTGGRVTDMEMHNGMLVVAGTFSRKLVALNAHGQVTTFISNKVQGRLPNSDSAQVFKFDISKDGTRLVAVGNFTHVDDAERPRVFMLDLVEDRVTRTPLPNARLSPWNYEPLGLSCTSTRTNAIAYVQDIDFAPDSSYFALAAFGYMYQTGQRGLQICDSVSRFETETLDPSQPTWINYTGGDSLKSVAVTGAAVYVQGHSRWLDNPFGQDSWVAPAVDRLGGGAVNPVTGLAHEWNPVMPQQSGGYRILPTAAGVWFATDGTRFGGEYHAGIRFAPLPPLP